MTSFKSKKFINLTKNKSILGLVSLVIFLSACVNLKLNQEPINSSIQKITIKQLIESPQNYFERTITLQGKIGDFLQPSSRLATFTLEENNWFGKDYTLLVLDPNRASTLTVLPENQKVQMTGEVRQFILAEFERLYDLPWDINLRRWVFSEYEGKPVIIVSTIKPIE
ncbi:hypothetical protein PCC7424_4461 [Gloeothece citriformis PCC 7424]|uniref:Lipoprotein n=1 Tax=Gloeothece citriformis (strain PCC 7424) TaxID=65393 RepID=B7K956_GLOC7|nr:hypothetical protein PCC7424_4461 [Gloeothece citriformis PCC 7424]